MADRPSPPSNVGSGGERPPTAAEAAQWAAMMQAYYKAHAVPTPYFGPGPPHPAYGGMWTTGAGPSYASGTFFGGTNNAYLPSIQPSNVPQRVGEGSAQDSSSSEESEETEPGKIVGGIDRRRSIMDGHGSTGKKRNTSGKRGTGTTTAGKSKASAMDAGGNEGEEEKEAKKQRRKQSNRESARRSRLRKQAECEELGMRVEGLERENARLRQELDQVNKVVASLLAERAMLDEQLKDAAGSAAANSDHRMGEGGRGRDKDSKEVM